MITRDNSYSQKNILTDINIYLTKSVNKTYTSIGITDEVNR